MQLGLLVSIILTLSACAHVGVTTIAARPANPPECPLDVFTSETEISKPFEVVCLIDAQKKSGWGESSIAAAIAASKPAACKCGANGILFMGGGTQPASAFNYGNATALVKAIRYKIE